MTLAELRAQAVSRILFPKTSLARALDALGFVQADPIRAPARAQDLILRHRVTGYRAGDLERQYATLAVEEDHFVNYGFLSRAQHALMHPRVPRKKWPPATERRARALLAFVARRKAVHPREADAHFAGGRVTNAWGGTSSATTHLLDDLHYRGWLRVARRENGIRIYAPAVTPPRVDLAPAARLDALIDLVVRQYAPLPRASLTGLVSRLRYCAPQWAGERPAALKRAMQRLSSARVEGVDWFWPDERAVRAPDGKLRLLAPFDPVVWDRRRVALLWGWDYRFEAYTPVAKRRLGYYALPMLWQGELIGWANLSVVGGQLVPDLNYRSGRAPRERAFRVALEAELEAVRRFLR